MMGLPIQWPWKRWGNGELDRGMEVDIFRQLKTIIARGFDKITLVNLDGKGDTRITCDHDSRPGHDKGVIRVDEIL